MAYVTLRQADDFTHADFTREESKISEHVSVAGTTVIDDKEKRESPKVSFWKVVRLNAPEWKLIAVGCVCSIIIGFSMPLFIVVFGDLFGSMSSSDPSELLAKVEFVSLACIVIGVVMGLSHFIEATSFGAAGAYLTERLRVHMFQHLMRQNVAFYDYRLNSTGALCARLSGEAAQVQAIAIEAVSNIRTVASLGRERQVLAEYTARLQPALGPARRAAHCRGVVAGLSRSMFNFINAVALTYGGHLIVNSGVAYEHILITTQSLQMASGQAQNAFTFAPDFHKGITAASRILEFLKSKSQIVDPEKPITDFKASGEVNFEDVEFTYPSLHTARVLKGLSFHLERGTTVALVGQSGCGKSTVVQLLQRFYDPYTGTVSLDGFPLPQLRVIDVRSSLGLVSQEPVLFDRTIAENIAYGDTSRTVPFDDIKDAAEQANIHRFIVSLPQGYETNIGSKGTQLSGGQKQRVAIARALVRRPKILLLDEATSALDSESEKVVQEALDKGRIGRSCITIAHRLSTVRDADCICVISDGRVAESGTHSTLMNRKGIYYNLYNSGTY
ncbi:hypothetical protein evm_004451 [Chilo suppressalis]|nr:hypothetical protein evm_004451 [Chilo suppressalis]